MRIIGTQPTEVAAGKKWSKAVTERKPATFAKEGIHTKGPKAIYEEYIKPSVSPKGPGQAIQMLSFYINRAGKTLKPEHKKNLKAAIKLLQAENERRKKESKA